MKKDSSVRDAIDESLSSIRFNAQDERSVLRRVRARREEEQSPVRAKKRGFRLDFAFALGMVLVLVIPLTVFTLRAGSLRTQRVVPLSDTDDPVLLSNDAPEESHAVASAAPVFSEKIDESAAIRVTRDIYNAVCDTSIFTFEEFTVTCTLTDSQYTVLMESIYGNGCTFETSVDAENSDLLWHSMPEKATHPDISALESEKAQAWYKRNGSSIFTWAPATQAEFSRRYEGATLREPKEGELSFAQASDRAQSAAASYGVNSCYPMLFSERASSDGVARYRVFCFTGEAADSDTSINSESAYAPLPAAVVVLNAATGDIELVRAFDAEADELPMKGLVK